MMFKDTIIILYEYSGVFTELYRELGYNVLTYDKQLDGKDARIHIPYDQKLTRRVKGVLSFTPCDHLAVSGARWWEDKGDEALIEALSLADVWWRFNGLYNPDFSVLENPVGRLSQFYGKPKMYIHPHEFAGWSGPDEAYTKKTCLWGNFKPPRKRDLGNLLGSKIHKIPPGPDRKNIRSKTPVGFARAFVNANK